MPIKKLAPSLPALITRADRAIVPVGDATRRDIEAELHDPETRQVRIRDLRFLLNRCGNRLEGEITVGQILPELKEDYPRRQSGGA